MFDLRWTGEWLVDLHPVPFVRRLRQRKVVQWILGYLAFAWLALQLTDALREIWNLSQDVTRAITLILGLGIFPATIIAWYHGEKGRQQLCVVEVLAVSLLTIAAAGLVWRVCFAAA